MANAVLVIDMLRGFLEEGHPLYCGDNARRIIPSVQALLERELTQGSKIFFLSPTGFNEQAAVRLRRMNAPPT